MLCFLVIKGGIIEPGASKLCKIPSSFGGNVTNSTAALFKVVLNTGFIAVTLTHTRLHRHSFKESGSFELNFCCELRTS